MTWERPSVGRIVHYRSYGTPGGEFMPECRAAVVTSVINDTTVDLAVLNPEGMFFNRGVYLDGNQAAGAGGTWHWPERI